jgi:hypothetical protein
VQGKKFKAGAEALGLKLKRFGGRRISLTGPQSVFEKYPGIQIVREASQKHLGSSRLDN